MKKLLKKLVPTRHELKELASATVFSAVVIVVTLILCFAIKLATTLAEDNSTTEANITVEYYTP